MLFILEKNDLNLKQPSSRLFWTQNNIYLWASFHVIIGDSTIVAFSETERSSSIVWNAGYNMPGGCT